MPSLCTKMPLQMAPMPCSRTPNRRFFSWYCPFWKSPNIFINVMLEGAKSAQQHWQSEDCLATLWCHSTGLVEELSKQNWGYKVSTAAVTFCLPCCSRVYDCYVFEWVLEVPNYLRVMSQVQNSVSQAKPISFLEASKLHRACWTSLQCSGADLSLSTWPWWK